MSPKDLYLRLTSIPSQQYTAEFVQTLHDGLATLAAENERLRAENDTFSQQNRAWIRENTRLEASIAALEEALRAYVHGQYARGQELARAVLARPTPTPDQRQYGKKCAHDGYVVAGCRDCEARATTPAPEGEQG